MICSTCGGLVLWNDRFTETECQHCGARNNQTVEDGEDPISNEEYQS